MSVVFAGAASVDLYNAWVTGSNGFVWNISLIGVVSLSKTFTIVVTSRNTRIVPLRMWRALSIHCFVFYFTDTNNYFVTIIITYAPTLYHSQTQFNLPQIVIYDCRES